MKMPKIGALYLILMLSLILAVLGIWWGLPDYRGWAPDEIVPGRVVDGLNLYFSHGWFDRYPPFHYYLLSLIYSPFLILHDLHLIDLHQLTTYTMLFYLGRLLSVAMGTAIIYLIYRCGREVFDRRAATFAALIAALIVPFEYYSKMINLDVPYTFWFVGSLYYYIRLLKTQRPKYYLLFAAAAAIAVCTKDQAYGLYVLAPLPVVILGWKYRRQSDPHLSFVRSLADRKYLYSLLLGAGLFCLLDNLVFNLRGFLSHVELIRGGASESYRIFPASLSGQARLLEMTLRQIQGSLGWPLFLICGAGLLAFLLRGKKNPLLLALPVFAVSYYVFYIARILFNCDRYNLPICIVLSFFGGLLISDLLNPAARLRTAKLVLVAAIFGFSFLYSLSVDVLMIADSRYTVEGWVKKNVPRQAVIGVIGPGEYGPRLPGYQVRNLAPSMNRFQMAPKPDFVIFPTLYSRRFPERTAAHRFFSEFSVTGEGYKLALRRQTSLPWLVIRYHNIGTNMILLNPEIQVYRRLGWTQARPS